MSRPQSCSRFASVRLGPSRRPGACEMPAGLIRLVLGLFYVRVAAPFAGWARRGVRRAVRDSWLAWHIAFFMCGGTGDIRQNAKPLIIARLKRSAMGMLQFAVNSSWRIVIGVGAIFGRSRVEGEVGSPVARRPVLRF